MANIKNAAFIMLALDASAFHTILPKQKRSADIPPFFSSPNNDIPFFANIEKPEENEKHHIKVGEYISKKDGSIQQFPSLGKEFKQLSGEDFHKAMFMAYTSGDPTFLYDCFTPDQVNEIMVCSIQDYIESEHSGNCYNLATGTQCGEDEEYEQQFPRGEIPALGFDKKQDNCDSIKHDLLLEPGMRMKDPDEECEPDEREIISYYSPIAQDVHFVAAIPKTALPDGKDKQYFHKSGGQPARPIDSETIASGHIPGNSVIFIVKDSRENFDIYDKSNNDRMRFSNEETPPYEECDRFCYKIQQERQSGIATSRSM